MAWLRDLGHNIDKAWQKSLGGQLYSSLKNPAQSDRTGESGLVSGKRGGGFAEFIGMGTPQLADISARYDPTANQPDFAAANEARARQSALASMLEAQARGQGPSLAQAQLQRGTDSALAQAMALSRSQTGQGAGLAARNVAQQHAQISQQAASDAALLRMQEQLGAQSALGGILSGIRGQDVQAELERAQLAQQAQQFKQTALERQQEREAGLFTTGQERRAKTTGGLLETFGKAILGGGGGSASDERLKEGVRDADSDIDKLLAGLDAKSFRYKKPELDGEGRRIGVMAQDLERSDIGSDLVSDTPRGKLVDYDRALPLLLAASARLHERLDVLENRGAGSSISKKRK